MLVSATSWVSTSAMTAATTKVPTTARRPIVEYWRRMKALAPSRIVPATSCIACGPLSRDSTSRASQMAKTIAAIPAMGMIHYINCQPRPVRSLLAHPGSDVSPALPKQVGVAQNATGQDGPVTTREVSHERHARVRDVRSSGSVGPTTVGPCVGAGVRRARSRRRSCVGSR